MKAPYDRVTGKNTIDMTRYLHGGELRMTAEIAAELSRRHEIIEREFRRNQRTVLNAYRARGWCEVPDSWRNYDCCPARSPIRSGRLMVSPREELIVIHIDETMRNSGEVTTWMEKV